MPAGRRLSQEEFKACFDGSMINVIAHANAAVDIWPMSTEIAVPAGLSRARPCGRIIRREAEEREPLVDETRRKWILAQIDEIGKRHGTTDNESFGELLARAAASGDEQAIKLIEMEIGDIRL